MNIEEIFPNGAWKNDYEYVIYCPYCPEGDHSSHSHCHVNPAKGVFHCFRCGESGSAKRLINEHGGAVELVTEEVVTKAKQPTTDFSQFRKVLGTEGSLDRMAFTYLKERNITKKDIDKYDIRYSTHGRYYGRVLFPMYENKQVVSFVGRSFLHFIEPSYLFPHRDETILTTAEAIFGYDRMQENLSDSLVLTEGVFDAIAVDRAGSKALPTFQAVALMSKSLSQGQLIKLLKLHEGTRFYIMLDADAHEDALLIARRLSAYARYVQVAFLTKGDPASILKEEVMIVLEDSQIFSEELFVETLLEGNHG